MMKKVPIEKVSTELPPKWSTVKRRKKAAAKAARLANLQKANAAREAIAGARIVLEQRQRDFDEAVAKAVETEVSARINRMCAGETNLPSLWSLSGMGSGGLRSREVRHQHESAIAQAGSHRKDRSLCRQIGLGGTYDLKRSATH